MSASAAKAASLPRLRKPRNLSPWAKEGKTPWFATPVGYLHLARLVTPSASATAMVLLCAASEQGANEADVKQKSLAVEVALDVDTVQEAISELEEIGAIRKRARLECKKRGESRFVYELLVGNWGTLKPLPEAAAAEPEAAEPEAAEPEAAEPEAAEPEAMVARIKIARNEAKPIPLPRSVVTPSLKALQCKNLSEYPIAIDAKFANGSLSIDVSVEKKRVIAEPPGENTDTSRLVELRNMLNRALGAHLGFVPDDDLRAIGAALDPAPVDHLARRVHQRRAMLQGGKGTWGGVLLLARDCAKAFAAASASTPSSSAAAPTPTELDVSATIARQEAYEAHCEQLFDAWWTAQSAQERAKLAKRHTGVILAQFAGAQLWPAAQLAESVHAAIRAEALKSIAPSFREFAAAKAKGASA